MTDEAGPNKADPFTEALEQEARLTLADVRSSTSVEELLDGLLDELTALIPPDKRTDESFVEENWGGVRERILKAAYATRPYCVRCGTCCTKGSPTLLEQDLDLLARDIIKPTDVFTIRKGELTHCKRTRQVSPTEEELIKVRETLGEETCIFYGPETRECSIYEDRPHQCRGQECWNPEGYEEIAGLPKLDRRPLLEPIDSLWEIVRHHEETCSYDEMERAVASLAATEGRSIERVLELVKYDHHIRKFIGEKFGIGAESLDFFFGRPMRETIRMYGLVVRQEPDGSFLLTRGNPSQPDR